MRQIETHFFGKLNQSRDFIVSENLQANNKNFWDGWFDLKDYFSQFVWYNPVGKNVKIDPSFNNIIKAVDEIKAKRKK